MQSKSRQLVAGYFCLYIRQNFPSKELRPMKLKISSTIVLIDDDLDLLDLLASFFKQRGYKVHAFNNAEEALIEIESSRIECDVVISDLKLPAMSSCFVPQFPESGFHRRFHAAPQP